MIGASGQQLPLGWVQVPLRDVLLPTTTTNPRTAKEGTFLYIDIEAVDNQRQRVSAPRRIENALAPSRARNALRAGDVIFSLVRPYLKNIAIIAAELDFAVASTAFFVCRPGQGIDSRFLLNFLRREVFITSITTYGSSPPAARDEEFERLPVLVPPSAEQSRVADTLDELFSDLDAGVAALERVKEKLKLYRASVLKAAVDGELTATKSAFRWGSLGEAIVSIGQGWSPKCESLPSTDVAQWAVIKTTAIQPLRYCEEHNKRLPDSLDPRPHLELAAGDLLVTRAGPRSRVGVACLVRKTRPRLMLCDKAYRVRCEADRVTPAFLEVALNAPQVIDELDKLKTGISDSGVNLTQDRFAELLVPYPPLPEQDAIVEAVEDQLSVIDHLETELDAKLKSAVALRQSILRHAFTGQLVPQDPNDEPASELLKRIAAEREACARETAAAKRFNKKTSGPGNGRSGRSKKNKAEDD